MGFQCTLYNVCFFFYVWLIPVFLQYLMRAPSTFDSAPFFPVPIRILNGDVPEITMSSFPQTMTEGFSPCKPCQEASSARGMYQWEMELSMSYKSLIERNGDRPVSTMYPVIFASNDGTNWRVVADAGDVSGHGEMRSGATEATHISAPLLVANLKNFGCVDGETGKTDPFMNAFKSHARGNYYKWKLDEHVALHGSVNLVACVMQGMDDVNGLVHDYANNCIQEGGTAMKCHLTPRAALQKCFALGSACGQACGIFAPQSPHCHNGEIDPILFDGLTKRRVRIKTSPGGGGAQEALVYCSQDKCQSGWHFKNMYVEAENPVEFLEAQIERSKEKKGIYYVVLFAASDFHKPVHTFTAFADDDDEGEDEGEDKDEDKDEDEDEHKHSKHHLGGHHLKDDLKKADKKDTDKEDHKKKKPQHHKEKKKPKVHKPKKEPRGCVDLPGVRLDQIGHSDLIAFTGKKSKALKMDPKKCTAACGRRASCRQSIFSAANGGCYLFKLATVEVNDFSDVYNSSYCGPAKEKDLMMTMLHQAYKGFVPREAPPAGEVRRLAEKLHADDKLYWQIAHVPNLTDGVMKDQGAANVRVIPRNKSCFTSPGFVYMVACMTSRPVTMNLAQRTFNVRPPPFNDRCLAVGGLCGASCGSDNQVSEDAKRMCKTVGRRLQGGSLYEVSQIPHENLVTPIAPRRSATAASFASRAFFHLFIFFIAISYIATLLGKFPGNFTDFYPMHTWDEIRTHGYVLEKFGSAASVGCSASENKMTILRNWVGKVSARPVFDDRAFPTFAKWVDVFVDEGHREGARLLWMAWTDFLDTDPAPEFIEEWAANLQNMSWDQAATKSPFDLVWKDGKKDRNILPLHAEQAQKFAKTPGEESPEGGVELAPDCLAKLKDLYELFKVLPDNLKMDNAISNKDDCVLTRGLKMSVMEDEDEKGRALYTIAYKDWRSELERKVKERMEQRNQSKDQYQKSLAVVDCEGQAVDVFTGKADLPEKRFPLHCREPPTRQDRQVILIYIARARPEGDSVGVDKTRTLDKFLWACLRPKAVKRNSGRASDANQKTPLLKSDRAWSSVTGAVVRNCVEGVMSRQHDQFSSGLEQRDAASPSGRGASLTSLHKVYFSKYSKYRTVDSDWEMARNCYGQVVGEGKDVDGDEVLVLDNPSPALLELISDIHGADSDIKSNPGMGLVSTHNVEEQQTMCGMSSKSVHSYAAKPTLDFMFTNTSGNSRSALGADFEKEFRKQLATHLDDKSLDFSGLKFQEKRDNGELIVEVSGPGRLIEMIRAEKISSIKVQSYQGRMQDNHPTVIIKRDLLAPYMGVRGKSGGLNFAVDLLQMREGFIGTGDPSDPTPDRMLFGIFDARHQPHPDFWRKCLPKFMNNTEFGYTYEINDAVTLVQAPQSFALVAIEEDILDVLNGMTFNIMNVIRNRCGGVTSCGTNAVWQIDAKEFTRTGPDDDRREYFDSRTKIEDTASTHMLFCKGKRSVYVQETVSTGIAKLNSDYLCAMQRWAEGAVQLFWIQIFKDKTKQLICFGAFVLSFLGMILYTLYGYWTKDILGYNVVCDIDGTPTLLLGNAHGFCTSIYNIFNTFTLHTNDKIMFQMAIHEYMRLVDFALTWFLGVSTMAGIAMLLVFLGLMPKVVRMFIMLENISYWLTSCSIFFWTSLTLFMVLGGDPPLMFNVTHFMMFVLLMNIAQHSMINEYKSLGGCDETSIWRAQQSYTLAAPLYVLAIVRGTASAWGIIWNRLDKSFWTSADHGSEIVVGVTLWVTFIWCSFVASLIFFLTMEGKAWLLAEMGDNVQKQCQLGALCMLGLLAMTVLEPFMSLWGLNKMIDKMANDRENRPCAAWVCGLFVWWRGRAWIMRYVIDFGMPLLVFSGALGGGVSLINAVMSRG